MAIQKVVVVAANGLEAEYTPLQTSAGAGSAGAIPALNSSGQIDLTMMPTGVGPDTINVTASAALTTDSYVGEYLEQYWNGECASSGYADATKPAHGFVLSGYSSSASAMVISLAQIIRSRLWILCGRHGRSVTLSSALLGPLL